MKKCSLFFTLVLIGGLAHPQGCIVVRNISGYGQFNITDNSFSESPWQLNFSTRYFKAFRDFKGTHDQKTAPADRSIVHSFTTDLTVTRFLKNGWSLDFSIPMAANSRNADQEHAGAGTTRHTTRAFGLGDIRLTGYKWLLKNPTHQRGNIQLGLGIKFATGDYKYQDDFYSNDTTKVQAPVNGSIQLGDGGTGLITEVNGYYFFTSSLSAYGNFYYLINPRDENGVTTLTWRAPTALQIETDFNIYSVPDIYSFRAGLNYSLKQFAFSAGVRQDGEPVHDLFGGSDGLRRPGHNLSFEPGVVYRLKRASFYLYAPFIIARKIRQNIPDALATKITGIYRIGAGGSGNYQVFAGVQFKL